MTRSSSGYQNSNGSKRIIYLLLLTSKKNLKKYIFNYGELYLVFEHYFDIKLGPVPIIRFIPGVDMLEPSQFCSMKDEIVNELLGIPL